MVARQGIGGDPLLLIPVVCAAGLRGTSGFGAVTCGVRSPQVARDAVDDRGNQASTHREVPPAMSQSPFSPSYAPVPPFAPQPAKSTLPLELRDISPN